MSKTAAKKIVKQYAKVLEESDYPFEAIYLFGSHLKGEATQWSDIDVAVVSRKLEKNYDANRLALWRVRRAVDLRIEPHGFTPNEFASNTNPMAYEIRTTGERIV